MAQKRMFNIEVASNDNFIDLPAAAQALYFHLGLRADDDGFVGGIKQIVRGLGFQGIDVDALVDAGYVIKFSSGVVAITDWKLNNSIRKDRYTPTLYQKELALLQIIDGRYALLGDHKTECVQPHDTKVSDVPQPNDNQMTTVGQPHDNQVSPTLATQVRLDKVRLDKVRLDEDREDKDHPQQNNVRAQENRNVISFVEHELCMTLSGVAIDQINSWLDEWPDREVIRFAVSEAVLNNKRSIKYVDAILRDWRGKGIQTIAQARAAKADFETQKANAVANKGTQNKTTRAPDNFKTGTRDLDFLIE